MAKKTEIQYVIDAVTGSSFGKTLRTVNKELAGLRMAHAEAGAGSKKAARGTAVFGGGMIKTALGAAVAYVGITQLAAGYKSVAAEAQGSIRAQTRLETLMGNVKGNTLKDVQAINQHASALQKVTSIEDDVIKVGASQLATFQLQGKSINKLLPAFTDLAAGMFGVKVGEEGAIKVGNMLGKAYMGNVGSLQKAGISFTQTQIKMLKHGTEAQKVAAIIEVVNANYGKLAKNLANTPEGRIERLAIAWNDVKQAIGLRLMPVQEKAVKFLSDNLPAIAGLIDKGFGGIDKIAAAMKPLAKEFKPIIMAVQYLGKDLPKLGAGFLKSLQPLVKALPSIAKGIFQVFVPILAFVTGKLLPFVKKVAADVIGLFLKIWPKVQPALVQLGGAIGKLLTAIMPILKAVWAIAKPILTFVLGTVLPIVIKAVSWAITAISKIVDALVSAVKWVGNLFSGFKKIVELLINNSILGFAIKAGKAIGKVATGKRAAGGPVSAGRGYLVGEKGPEWFSPRRSGFVSPTPALAGAGGGGGIHIGTLTIQVQGGSPREAREAGRQAGRGFAEEMKRFERDRDRRSFQDR